MIRSHTIKRNSRQRAHSIQSPAVEQIEIEGLLYDVEIEHIISTRLGILTIMTATLVNDSAPFTCLWYGIGEGYNEALEQVATHIREVKS